MNNDFPLQEEGSKIIHNFHSHFIQFHLIAVTVAKTHQYTQHHEQPVYADYSDLSYDGQYYNGHNSHYY